MVRPYNMNTNYRHRLILVSLLYYYYTISVNKTTKRSNIVIYSLYTTFSNETLINNCFKQISLQTVNDISSIINVTICPVVLRYTLLY